MRQGYDTNLGIDFKSSRLIGPLECTEARHATGSYGSWIVYRREVEQCGKFMLQERNVRERSYNDSWVQHLQLDAMSVTLIL